MDCAEKWNRRPSDYWICSFYHLETPSVGNCRVTITGVSANTFNSSSGEFKMAREDCSTPGAWRGSGSGGLLRYPHARKILNRLVMLDNGVTCLLLSLNECQ